MSHVPHPSPREVAAALLDVGAVVFAPGAPVTFKSGLRSPVYVDARRLPFRPAAWTTVVDAFRATIAGAGLRHDAVAGIEAAGIPHSAALGFATGTPSVFVRKQAKSHGLRGRVEGGDVAGLRVLLVEDLVTTGGSSLAGVEALRAAGARVDACLCIASYGFREARDAFAEAGVRLHVMAPFPHVLEEAVRRGDLDEGQADVVRAWWEDPRGWAPAGDGGPT